MGCGQNLKDTNLAPDEGKGKTLTKVINTQGYAKAYDSVKSQVNGIILKSYIFETGHLVWY